MPSETQEDQRTDRAARLCGLLYLPAYSPGYNPIEGAFAKIKNLLRKAAVRSKEALVEAIGAALSAVTAAQMPEAYSSMPGTARQANYCETCCQFPRRPPLEGG